MEDTKSVRRERRRRKTGPKMEGNRATGNEFEKIENVEFSIRPHVTHSFGKILRRDTHEVLRSKSDFELGTTDDTVKSPGSSTNDSADSRIFTSTLSEASDTSLQRTYNVDQPTDPGKTHPIPAPRKRKSKGSEVEKISSDTDRDVAEIDLDDPKTPRPAPSGPVQPQPDDAGNKPVTPPVPKPRKTAKNVQMTGESSKNEQLPKRTPTPKPEIVEERTEKVGEEPKVNWESSGEQEGSELPLVAGLEEEAKSEEKQKANRQTKQIGELLDRKKKKKSKTFSALMRLERRKMPIIATIWKGSRDLKGEETEKGQGDAEEDKQEFQIPSKPYAESVHNGQIYVQGKNGFRVRGRHEVLGNGNGNENRNLEKGGSGGMTAGSPANAAILFQKYWSRAMTYFHGVLAGFGFGHAATVTAIMLHHNYEPREFIGVYSCLSLKIHYAFYTLIALCIVSCFDRLDVGHMNRTHWDTAWKAPSACIVLVIYAIGFALTLANQVTVSRFDALPGGNETEIWSGQTQSDVQIQLLQWYHGIWARDVLVLVAWLVIALTKFDDLLLSHIINMAVCGETKGDKSVRQKTEYF